MHIVPLVMLSLCSSVQCYLVHVNLRIALSVAPCCIIQWSHLGALQVVYKFARGCSWCIVVNTQVNAQLLGIDYQSLYYYYYNDLAVYRFCTWCRCTLLYDLLNVKLRNYEYQANLSNPLLVTTQDSFHSEYI